MNIRTRWVLAIFACLLVISIATKPDSIDDRLAKVLDVGDLVSCDSL